MLFVFLALYAVLGIGCAVVGASRRKPLSLLCGMVSLALVAAFLVAWTVVTSGASGWTPAMIQALLSPMPESLVEPESLAPTGRATGLPLLAVSTLELLVAIVIWAIPIVGIASATSTAPVVQSEPAT